MTTFVPADTIAVLQIRIGEPENNMPFTYPPPASQVEEASLVPPIEHLIPAGVDPSSQVGAITQVPANGTVVNP